MRRLFLVLSMAFSLSVQSGPAMAAYSSLYVFGDSLVDSGNAQIGAALYGLSDPAPAAAGYVGGRFSNGGNFVDYLSVALFGSPSVPALAMTGGTNFAVGGATAVSNPVFPPIPPGFQQELQAYALTGTPIPSDALVLINFGGNDVRDAIGLPDPFDFTPSIQAISSGITALVGAGAQHFLLVGLPDIGLLPSTLVYGPAESSLATTRTLGVNAAFQSLVATSAGLGLDIDYFDLFGLEQDLLANPAAYGLPAGIDPTTPCLIGGSPTVVGGCDGFVYFDGIHPTTQVHAAIATAILGQLSAVPEPQVWMLLIIGFLAAGTVLRRDRLRAIPA